MNPSVANHLTTCIICFIRKKYTMSNNFIEDDSADLINQHDQLHEFSMFSKVMGQEISENGGNTDIYTDIDEKPVIVKTLIEDQEETKTKEYICDVCVEVFSHSSGIKEHMGQHKRSRPLYCKRCDQYFVLGDNFSAHKQQHEIEDSVLCPACGKRFKSMGGLAAHMKLHGNKDTFECGICCKCFTSSHLLISHIESHSSTPIYACEICHEGARSLKLLQCHKMNVHNIYNTKIYRYGCTICSKRFKNRPALTTHENKHHVSTGKLPSEKCRQSSNKQFSLVLNQDTHETLNRMNPSMSDTQESMDVSEDDTESQTRNQSMTCMPDNNPDFYKNSNFFSILSDTESEKAGDLSVPVQLIENSSAINNGKDDYIETIKARVDDKDSVTDKVEETSNSSKELISECDVTSSTINSSSETLTSAKDFSHEQGEKLGTFIDKFVADKMGYCDKEVPMEDTETIEENYESKSYTCDLCSHRFEGFKAIKAHMLQHNNLKPHHCARCDLYFVLARNMRTHLIQHEVEDPLVCQLCSEVFHTNEGLNNHNLTHLEYFPFKCDICQRGFQTQSTYNLHMRFHNNTAFECSLCEETFPSKQSLQTHVRNKHFIYDKRYRFGCDQCQMKFRGSDVLKRHKRYSHNMAWSELIPKKLRKQFQRKRGGKGFL